MPGDPECAYRFFVDAKHERYCEVDGPVEGATEDSGLGRKPHDAVEHGLASNPSRQDSFPKFPMEQEEWSAALQRWVLRAGLQQLLFVCVVSTWTVRS